MSNPYQPPQTTYGMQPGYPSQPGSDGLAIAALICGVLSLVFTLCCTPDGGRRHEPERRLLVADAG